eukprot:5024812-Alexandrium_andersonii.AAC.1
MLRFARALHYMSGNVWHDAWSPSSTCMAVLSSGLSVPLGRRGTPSSFSSWICTTRTVELDEDRCLLGPEE